ncbi:hypothetical protein JOH51_002048 [Rhizobium leguminosarum]|nr:hypothetical protein [Rhizobium leguminosarum]
MVCFTNRPSAATILPLTPTLSPRAGRGDVPCAMFERAYSAAYPFSPSERGEGGGSRMRGSTSCGGLI